MPRSSPLWTWPSVATARPSPSCTTGTSAGCTATCSCGSGDRALAEDLTSETFLRALRRIHSFSWQGKDIAAWFITIARNLVADHVKSARFRFEVTTADLRDADRSIDAPDNEVLDRERDDRLLCAIRGLRPSQAECLALRFLQGLTLAETARVLGRSEGAVKQLQLRAIRALRDVLEDLDR